MKTPIKSLSDKILTLFFASALVIVCMCIVLCIRCLRDYHIYTDGGEYAKQYELRTETQNYSDKAIDYYYCVRQSNSPKYSGENEHLNIFQSQIDTYVETFSEENCNMFFEIIDSTGETVFGTKAERGDPDYQYCCSYPYMINYTDENGTEVREEGFITCYVAALNADGKFPVEDGNYSLAFRWINVAAKTGMSLFALFAIVALMATILIGILLCSAGTTDANGKTIAKFADRVPLDLYAGTVFMMSCFAVGTVPLTKMSVETIVSQHLVIFIVTLVITALVIALLLTLATRIKIASQNPGKGVFKNTLIYMGYRWLRIKLKIKSVEKKRKIDKKKKKLGFGSLTTCISVVKVLGAISLIVFSYFEFIQKPNWQLYIAIWIIGHIIIMPLYFMLSFNIDKLLKGWQNLAEGNLDEEIDTDGLFSTFADIGKSLENVRQDINHAYDTEAKSQMLRNELIANVSHDIKTPLTSIVNYVGLLKKDESISEQSQEYLDVLDFQADKLKKLLVNLIEASAVSSGDVTINPEPTDVRMLLEQTAAEYSDMLRKQHLILSLSLPESETIINVDGQHIWRIFENLMSNICKYAAEATNVWLSLEVINKKAVLTFKNESKYAYPEGDGDMFLERFVRGDSSRTTEGNGLGLSIASNLTYLQNGTFEVETANNCFSVVLTFDLYIDPEKAPTVFSDEEETEK